MHSRNLTALMPLTAGGSFAALPCFRPSFFWHLQNSSRPGTLAIPKIKIKRRERGVVAASSDAAAGDPTVPTSKPAKASSSLTMSDVFWPSAGAFALMALLGKVDQVLAPKGISMSIAPFGAVCAVLFAAPSSPAAREYNMFTAQIGCAAIGVLAFTIWGPGWLAKSCALAASIAFMILTNSLHPPAASLPLLFIDGVKFHHLNYLYALFPGAAGCVLIWMLQRIVCHLKENIKF